MASNEHIVKVSIDVPRLYAFHDDELDALKALLDLVHYNVLAYQWYQRLPERLRKDLGD